MEIWIAATSRNSATGRGLRGTVPNSRKSATYRESHTKVALLNLLSVGAALGVITLVFQHGVLGGALGTSPRRSRRSSRP